MADRAPSRDLFERLRLRPRACRASDAAEGCRPPRGRGPQRRDICKGQVRLRELEPSLLRTTPWRGSSSGACAVRSRAPACSRALPLAIATLAVAAGIAVTAYSAEGASSMNARANSSSVSAARAHPAPAPGARSERATTPAQTAPPATAASAACSKMASARSRSPETEPPHLAGRCWPGATGLRPTGESLRALRRPSCARRPSRRAGRERPPRPRRGSHPA